MPLKLFQDSMLQMFYILLISSSLLISGCQMNNTTPLEEKKHCGIEMTDEEYSDVMTRAKNYNFSVKDMDLHI